MPSVQNEENTDEDNDQAVGEHGAKNNDAYDVRETTNEAFELTRNLINGMF